MFPYTNHANRTLDLTVSDPGLPAAIKFLAKMHTGNGSDGSSLFKTNPDRLCLAYRGAADEKGVYLMVTDAGETETDLPEWVKMQPGMHARKMAKEIRLILKNQPTTPPGFDGPIENGWRLRNPMEVALANHEADDDEPADFAEAFAYVEPFTCEYYDY